MQISSIYKIHKLRHRASINRKLISKQWIENIFTAFRLVGNFLVLVLPWHLLQSKKNTKSSISLLVANINWILSKKQQQQQQKRLNNHLTFIIRSSKSDWSIMILRTEQFQQYRCIFFHFIYLFLICILIQQMYHWKSWNNIIKGLHNPTLNHVRHENFENDTYKKKQVSLVLICTSGFAIHLFKDT